MENPNGNNARTYSLSELLNITADILVNISIPVKYGKSISDPIVMAVRNIDVGIQLAKNHEERIKELEEELKKYKDLAGATDKESPESEEVPAEEPIELEVLEAEPEDEL